MTSPLKEKATSGFIWTALDNFSSRIVILITGIVLARLLLPKDFGLISMLSIFIVISQAFVNSGMGSGLIQKQNRSDVDFSTVFVFNLIISLFIYAVLFLVAPTIADFYNEPQLITITRVLSINILINALAIVQRSRLQIEINFKSLAIINVLGAVISGIVAILAANYRYGVWALVIQQIVYSLVTVILLWASIKWKPSLKFSKKSFNKLFGFGSKLMIANIYAKIFQNIYEVTIGKYYSASGLGFYNRAKAFSETSSESVASILQQVTYPILSSMQNDTDRIVSVYKKMIKMAAFLIIPSMTLLALLAEPLIRVLLTEKWLASVVLLQILAIAKIPYPISVINMNVLNAVGRSDLFLKVDLSKTPIILIILLITVPISIKAMVIGFMVSSFISFFINAYLPGRLFGYGPIQQLQDMIPYLLASFGMGVIVYGLLYLIKDNYAQIVVGSATGIGSYLLISRVLGINELNEIKTIITERKNRLK